MKSPIVKAVRSVPGVLSDPSPEALVIDVSAADAVKLRVLWWTHDPRQHQMLASYDRVLSAIIGAFARSREQKQQRARAA